MTDVEADIDIMNTYVGYYNSYFYQYWIQFASPYTWDGQSCSEIACCVTFLAGNQSVPYVYSKIFVSNYAMGLVTQFQNANPSRFGHTPSKGAFIWFDYGAGEAEHTGRVIDFDSTYVYTFEGNVGGLTVQRQYLLNDPTIYGYGYPYYDNQPVPPPTPPTPPYTGKYFPQYYRHPHRMRGN